MAIVWYAPNRMIGVSGDTKPTNVPADTEFIETNTNKDFIFNGSAWVEM